MTDATNAARWALYGPAMFLGALIFLGQGDLAAGLVNRAAAGVVQFLDHLAPDTPDQISAPTPSPGAEAAPGPQTGPPPTGAGCTTCSIIEDPDGSFAYPHLRSHDG